MTGGVTRDGLDKGAGGHWQVQIRRQGVNVSGTFDTETAAQRWARRIESEIDEGRSVSAPRSAGTVADLLDRCEVAARAIRPLGRSKLHVLRQLRDGLGKALVRTLTTDRILAHAPCRWPI